MNNTYSRIEDITITSSYRDIFQQNNLEAIIPLMKPKWHDKIGIRTSYTYVQPSSNRNSLELTKKNITGTSVRTYVPRKLLCFQLLLIADERSRFRIAYS